MNIRSRAVLVVLAILVVGAVEAACPPVDTGYTTTYYTVIACTGEGCIPLEDVVGECTLQCDGTYSCWGQNTCGGLVRCRTTYVGCGPCEPD